MFPPERLQVFRGAFPGRRRTVVFFFSLAASALAGSIDGKWVSERKMERDGQSTIIVETFELRAESYIEPPPGEIKDGKIDGNKFSFTTMMPTPNCDMKTSYNGAVEDNVLKGNAEREGGQARPFEATMQ